MTQIVWTFICVINLIIMIAPFFKGGSGVSFLTQSPKVAENDMLNLSKHLETLLWFYKFNIIITYSQKVNSGHKIAHINFFFESSL